MSQAVRTLPSWLVPCRFKALCIYEWKVPFHKSVHHYYCFLCLKNYMPIHNMMTEKILVSMNNFHWIHFCCIVEKVRVISVSLWTSYISRVTSWKKAYLQLSSKVQSVSSISDKRMFLEGGQHYFIFPVTQLLMM